MYRDFKELLSVLNAHRVKYLVVGGYAVSVHAEPRATKDLDVLTGRGAENTKSLFTALAAFGAPLEGLTHTDFMEPESFFRMGTPPVMVDILSSIAGVDFDQAWQRRVEFSVDSALNAWFISREDLLAAKIAAGRPQDLADAAALGAQLDPAQSRPREAEEAEPSASDKETARKRAVADWLAYRAQLEAERGSQTMEEKRAKAVEDWKRLQKRKTPHRSREAPTRGKDAAQREQEEGGKGAEEDPDL